MFSFVWNCQSVFQSDCMFYILTCNEWESSCNLLRLFDSSDPGGWEVVSQFSFDLHSLMANDVELFFHAILYWGNIGL